MCSRKLILKLLNRARLTGGALIVRASRIGGQSLFMRAYVNHLRRIGVVFHGQPEYIGPTCRFDLHAPIEIGQDVVMSEYVSIITHDYSISAGLRAAGHQLLEPQTIVAGVSIGKRTFVGYGVLILPGAKIGCNVIIGGGSVVRGVVPDGAIIMGNPAKVVGQSAEWAPRRMMRADGADVIPRSQLKDSSFVQVMR